MASPARPATARASLAGASPPRATGAVARAAGILVPDALLVAVAAALWVSAGHVTPQHGGAGAALRDAAVALVAASALCLLGLPATVRRERVRRSGIADVDTMSGPAFEARLAGLFSAMGYAVEETGRRGDFGADLVVERDATRVVVQAKRYERAVGIEAVQQAIGATRHYGADGAMVVTNASCTPAARSLAASNDVRLVERGELVTLLAAHPPRTGAGPRHGRALRPARLVARQVGDGVVLLAYAVGLVLRVAWRVLARLVRPSR